MHPRTADIDTLVTRLLAAEIEFIVIGGAAGMLHGSPLFTVDFDLVHRRTADNVDRIVRFLSGIGAHFRGQLNGRIIAPNDSHLSGKGQILLSTSLGPVDFLGTIHDGRGYDELEARSVTRDWDGRPLRLLDLPTLIEVKTAAGREKDKLAIPHLVALMERKGLG